MMVVVQLPIKAADMDRSGPIDRHGAKLRAARDERRERVAGDDMSGGEDAGSSKINLALSQE